MMKLSASEEQDKWLADAMNSVKQQAYYVRRAIDANNLREALKYAAHMLSELRTSRLSPQKYYELYFRVCEQLLLLEQFFAQQREGGPGLVDLYELVQHAGNIVPRLYLLCTVGSVYVKSKEGPAKEVLSDLSEICKGVQHPIRGLFLRAYLTQVSRDKLPDAGSDYEGEGGTVADAVDFLLQNFTEMNKLWVRMQHQGPAVEKEKREQERRELRDLVGKNLHLLSQLEGVSLDMYKTTVLPRILEQIINCRDEIAQFYLMDCLIQVFPDDFHLHTLDVLLAACPELLTTVDVKTIMSNLMDRLSKFARQSSDVLPKFASVDAFSRFTSAVSKVLEAQPDMPLASVISLHLALLTFVLQVHRERLDFIDQVLASCLRVLNSRGGTSDPSSLRQLTALLSAVLDSLPDAISVLDLPHYGEVMSHLDEASNKVMAVVLLQSVLKREAKVSDPQKVEALLLLVANLVHEDLGGGTAGSTPQDDLDMDDFAEEQNLVARVVHVMGSDDANEMFQILDILRSHFLRGGSHRLPFTMPPLVFSSLALARKLFSDASIPNAADVAQKLFRMLHTTVETLSDIIPLLSLRLALQCAEVASEGGLEPVAYDLFTQAFVTYEEEISDSKNQITCLQLIIGTLQRVFVFSDENRDTLTHKATGYSSKLLKKADQCRAVCSCAHLFWSDDERGAKDGERVMLCLKRSLKIANAAQQVVAATKGVASHVDLLVEILNKYLYFFDKGNPHITPSLIQGLVERINVELRGEGFHASPALEAFFKSTLSHIREQKSKQGPASERYALIQL